MSMPNNLHLLGYATASEASTRTNSLGSSESSAGEAARYCNSFDHLPDLKSFAFPPVKVCYLDHQPYDFEPFLSYPHRRGWDHVEVVYKGRVPESCKREDVESFLQTWLVFGLICETCRLTKIAFQQKDFLRNDSEGRSYVTMRALLDYIPRWEAAFQSLAVEEAVCILEALEACVKVVATFAYRHIYKTGIFAQRCFVSPEVGLLIQVVGRISQHMITGVRREKDALPAPTYYWWPMKLIESRFVARGWCPFAAEKFQQKFPIDTQYFASLLPLSMTGATHRSCTGMACAINNIKDRTYVTRHQSEACDCTFINVDIDAMCDILDGPGNEVPLLSFQNVVGANAISPKVKPAGDMCSYVAISHVWFNGLGNPNANSLPECQLKYIRDLLLSTTTQKNMTADEAPITFWMDTLCVPVGDTLRQPRTKAIARMRRTYEDAATVLVLDSSLQQLSLQNSHVELLLQIVASPWFTRLWTLQEGALARRLAFTFRDGVMDIDDFMWVNLTDRNGWSVSGMHEPLKHRINHLRGLLRLNFRSERSQDPFSAILELFRDRQTTKASDEGICLATLLGLDPTDLINAPAD
jgi:hypothetical protein